MLVRRCAQGHKVYIFKPRGNGTNTYRFSVDEEVSFDAQDNSYVVTSDGAVVSRTNSWITAQSDYCLLYTSPSPRDVEESRMPSSA